MIKLPLTRVLAFVTSLASCCLVSVGAASTPMTPADGRAWSAITKADILAAYRETYANHPGVYDPNNPRFVQLLATARDNAMALAEKVTNAAGYRAALGRFSTTLQDGHSKAIATLDDSHFPKQRWPGFLAVWRGTGLIVYDSEPGGPSRGARIVSCDGRTPRDLMLENVFAFQGLSSEEGNWWSQGRGALVDTGNPFVSQPKTCIVDENGRHVKLPLAWREVDDDFAKWRAASYNGDTLAVGLTEPRPGLVWIAMPTFEPKQGERAIYRAMYKDLADHRERVLSAQAVVIDLRQNQGGSSDWSYELAHALWGKDRVDRRMNAYFAETQTWWRASKDNTAYVLGFARTLRDQQQAEDAAAWDKAGKAMAEAEAAGRPFYVESTADALAPKDANTDLPSDPPPLKTPVYVIVPGQCSSACLDALDVFTRFHNVTLIGAPSSADSTYLDIRSKDLPSGLGKVIIPFKMYVGRPRKAGQIYSPAILMTNPDWSTMNFLNLIEKVINHARP